MKLLLHAIVIGFLFLFAETCSKSEETFQAKGVITGIDARKCACLENGKCGCCGYWVIQIGEKAYIFKSLPKKPELDLQNAKFPINVSMDFHDDPDSCAQSWGYIIVDRFRVD